MNPLLDETKEKGITFCREMLRSFSDVVRIISNYNELLPQEQFCPKKNTTAIREGKKTEKEANKGRKTNNQYGRQFFFSFDRLSFSSLTVGDLSSAISFNGNGTRGL